MSEGLYYFNGHIIPETATTRISKKHEAKSTSIYNRIERIRRKHERELAPLLKMQILNWARRPYTPWVGSADRGAVDSFVANAQRDSLVRKGWAKELVKLLKKQHPTCEEEIRISDLRNWLRN